ncbi:MAG: FecR family protein [Opitutaceae bacterium]
MNPHDADSEFPADRPAASAAAAGSGTVPGSEAAAGSRAAPGSGGTGDRDEQASLWAARLDGAEPSAADADEFKAWLAADPVNAAAFDGYRKLSSLLDRTLPALAARGAVASPRTPAPARVRSLLQWWPLATLTAIAVVATVWLTHFAWPREIVQTQADQRRSITLSDGSRVELNARTNLIVESVGRVRRVRLAGGEAYFIVAKDPARPFVVETPAGSVRVTGTIFDVLSDAPADLEVTVVEGSVRVRTGAKNPPVLLRPGERFTSDRDTAAVSRLSAAALGDALAWRSGFVVFDGTPLERALAQFARYHGVRIEAAPGVAGLRVGGRFSLDDLDGFLSALEDGPLHVRVVRGPDEILVDRAPSR